MTENRIKKADFTIMQNLVGKKLNNIFKQLDFFIINFGDEIEYSLHTYCFLRIRRADEIILMASDEYYFPNYTIMPQKTYKYDELHEKSLLKVTTEKTKELLKNAIVKKVEVSDIADIFIEFDNGVIIETLTNFQQQNSEFFRFFKYGNLNEPHYVVKFEQGNIVMEIVYISQKDVDLLNSEQYLKFKENIKK